MIDRDWFEGRLERVSARRLVLSLSPATIFGSFFMVANLQVGRIGWAITFAILLMLEVAVIVWWIRVRRGRQRDRRLFRDALDQGPRSGV
jgi:Flp pilus assembly protein TadB